jgi:PAS domain S-box-containing protein
MNTRPRVLLVDSYPSDRALAALVLRREVAELEIEEAGDAMMLADRLPRGGYAAVVTEYRLAWGDGLQLLESVKSLDPDIPVVLFASAGSEAVAAEGLRKGAAAYLVKGSAGYLELPATVRRVVALSAEVRASREASASYHRLTEEMALGTFAAGGDGRLSLASPVVARILGFENADEVLGKSLADFLSDETLQAQVLASMARGREIRDLEAGVRRPGGDLAWVNLTAWPVVDTSAGVIRYEGVLQDISGRRKSERELSERAAVLGRSNEELQQFAYVISHDLQEPLQLIARYARLLANHGSTAADEDASRYLAHLLQCTDQMQAMINDVLAYARVETQAKPFTPVDFGEVVTKAMANLKSPLDESAGQVSWERLPVLAADAAQMAQLFQNLIANALKFRREKPQVRVFASGGQTLHLRGRGQRYRHHRSTGAISGCSSGCTLRLSTPGPGSGSRSASGSSSATAVESGRSRSRARGQRSASHFPGTWARHPGPGPGRGLRAWPATQGLLRCC